MDNLPFRSANDRFPNYMYKSCCSITMRLRRIDTILWRTHNNVTKEVCIVSICIIITLISHNGIPIINQCATSTKVISYLRRHIIIQTVTTKRPSRLPNYHIFPHMNHLCKAIIVHSATIKGHSSWASHVYQAKRFEPFIFLIEVSTVTT